MKPDVPQVDKLSDMTNWDMSRISYRSLEMLTQVSLKDFDINLDHPEIEVQVTPNFMEIWQIVKVLDDKETNTQAYAFKKGDEIVLAYRGSQEEQDWVDTDGNYLVLGANRTPSETRDFQEAYINSNSGNVYSRQYKNAKKSFCHFINSMGYASWLQRIFK